MITGPPIKTPGVIRKVLVTETIIKKITSTNGEILKGQNQVIAIKTGEENERFSDLS